MKTAKASLWLVCFVVLPLVTIPDRALATVPPAWLVYNYLYHSVGQTPGVVVEAPIEQASGDSVINVLVKERSKREALATLLVAHIDGLEAAATIRVVDGRGRVQAPLDISGTTKEKLAALKKLFAEAFRHNRIFRSVMTMVDSVTQQPEVYPIFNELGYGLDPDGGSEPYALPASVCKGAFDLVLRSVISDVWILPDFKRSQGGLQTGWVIGTDDSGTATILHTKNGGRQWSVQGDQTRWPGYNGNDISAVDHHTAWVALGGPNDESGMILHTTDGGATWVQQPLPPNLLDSIKGIKGLSRQAAWAVSLKGTLLRTTDGGATWNIVPPTVPISQVNRIDAIGGHDLWLTDECHSPMGMVHTADGGITWRKESLPYEDTESLGVHTVSASSPLVTWGTAQGWGSLFRTVDGGETWGQAAVVSGSNDLDDICAPHPNTVWAALNLGGNTGGRIFHVRLMNGQEPVVNEFTPIGGYIFEGITCLDDRQACVVGSRGFSTDPSLPLGVILFTSDGGRHWVSRRSPVDNVAFWKVSFVGAHR